MEGIKIVNIIDFFFKVDDDGNDNGGGGGGGKTFNILWDFVPALFKAVGMYSFN